jgi:hypothetical protein
MPFVKKVVYDYVLDEVLKNDTRSDMPEDFIAQDGLNSAPNLQAFLSSIIQPVRNRAHRLSLSREEVTKNPFIVLSIIIIFSNTTSRLTYYYRRMYRKHKQSNQQSNHQL